MVEQLKALIARLGWRQRILILAAAASIAGGMYWFTRWSHSRDFKPLFAQMAPEDASAVVQKLRESGSEFQLAENGTAVLVPSARVAELRLEMAGAGLPRSGRAGFELFDKTNFGLTDFAEHINYQRALEGELERSVMSLAEVQQARVHLTFSKDSVFVDQRQPAKASVMVKLRPGARMPQPKVSAITHLVSSAVEGLAPESVSVVDMQGALLSKPRRNALDGSEPNEATLDFKHQIEKDLLAKVNATLEPLLGAEKYRAGISVDCDFSASEQSEEVFDPTKSVMTSSQKTEDVSGANLASGVPGTASALPRPTSRPGGGSNGVARKTENISYQTSRLVKHTRLPQGVVKRLSVAVLVDQNVRWEGPAGKMKKVLEPPPPERLKTIRDLVAAATGADLNRGDQLTIESLPFESTLSLQPPDSGPAPASEQPLLFGVRLPQASLQVIAIAGAAGALVLLLLFVLLALILRSRRHKKLHVQSIAKGELKAGSAAEDLVEAAEKQFQERIAEQEAEKRRLEAEALNALRLPPPTTKKTEVLTKQLQESAKKDPVALAQVLRTWLLGFER